MGKKAPDRGGREQYGLAGRWFNRLERLQTTPESAGATGGFDTNWPRTGLVFVLFFYDLLTVMEPLFVLVPHGNVGRKRTCHTIDQCRAPGWSVSFKESHCLCRRRGLPFD
jgi:hypothetical protein